MKAHLPTAAIATAILVFASSTLAPTNAMASPSFVLQCGADWYTQSWQVWVTNVGTAPVPAGTVSKWQVPKRVVQIMGQNYTEDAMTDSYTFQLPLNPGGTVTAYLQPTPAPAPSGGASLPPWIAYPQALWIIPAISPRGCAITTNLSAFAGQALPLNVVSVLPGTPTSVSATRANANTVFLTWASGIATANFYVFDITTASSPPTDYHNWQNPVIVGRNVLKATISIPGATKPQTNYYMVCAANTDSTIVRCSQPVVERFMPIAPQQEPLVRPH